MAEVKEEEEESKKMLMSQQEKRKSKVAMSLWLNLKTKGNEVLVQDS